MAILSFCYEMQNPRQEEALCCQDNAGGGAQDECYVTLPHRLDNLIIYYVLGFVNIYSC